MRSNPDASRNGWSSANPQPTPPPTTPPTPLTPPAPRPKRSRKRNQKRNQKRKGALKNALPAGFEPKQPFGAMALPPEPDLGRKRGLLKVLKWTAPIALVVALFGLWLTSLFLWTTVARSQAEGGNLTAAERNYLRQEQATAWFPEPWLAQYNLGTTKLMAGNLDGGVEALSRAMDGVPKAVRGESGEIQPFSYECMVRMNLAAGIEMQGDEATAASLTEEGAEFYEDALALVTPCEVPPWQESSESTDGDGFDGSPEEQNQAASEQFQQDGNEAGDRLREKLGQGQPEPGDNEAEQEPEQGEGEQEPQESDDPFEGETQEERERREELEGHNRDQAERQREKEESGRRNPGIGGW